MILESKIETLKCALREIFKAPSPELYSDVVSKIISFEDLEILKIFLFYSRGFCKISLDLFEKIQNKFSFDRDFLNKIYEGKIKDLFEIDKESEYPMIRSSILVKYHLYEIEDIKKLKIRINVESYSDLCFLKDFQKSFLKGFEKFEKDIIENKNWNLALKLSLKCNDKSYADFFLSTLNKDDTNFEYKLFEYLNKTSGTFISNSFCIIKSDNIKVILYSNGALSYCENGNMYRTGMHIQNIHPDFLKSLKDARKAKPECFSNVSLFDKIIEN